MVSCSGISSSKIPIAVSYCCRLFAWSLFKVWKRKRIRTRKRRRRRSRKTENRFRIGPPKETRSHAGSFEGITWTVGDGVTTPHSNIICQFNNCSAPEFGEQDRQGANSETPSKPDTGRHTLRKRSRPGWLPLAAMMNGPLC